MLILLMVILKIVILKLLIILDLWLGIIGISNTKNEKKVNEELLLVTWYPTRAWDWCMSQDGKNEMESFSIDKT